MFDQKKESYGDVYTIEDFQLSVDCGGFISYDGDGFYGTATHYSFDTFIWVGSSELKAVPEGATHIHWFNR